MTRRRGPDDPAPSSHRARTERSGGPANPAPTVTAVRAGAASVGWEQVVASSWDVVVVGAGSAGGALAGRVAQRGDRTVLLLEAGPDWRPDHAPPELRGTDWTAICDPVRFPQYLWTELNARRTPAQEPELYWRGRGLGGSSSVNGTYAIRPPLDDFDAWPSGPSFTWSAEAALAGFVALEDDRQHGAEPYHGTGGPVPVDRVPVERWGPFDSALRDAAIAAGHRWMPDSNAPGSTGVGHYATNTVRGRRVTTNDAYIEPARSTHDLAVVGGAEVTSVLLDRRRRATGVRVRRGGAEEVVRAGEVVLCAGAVGSPAILQRSGIGPAGVLRGLGIAVVADLPVGEGLQDHPAVALGRRVPAERCSGTGLPLACVLRYASGAPGTKDNDVTVVAMPPRPGWPVGGLALWLDEVFSTGTVTVRSADPAVPPAVDLAMAAHPLDGGRLARGVDDLRALLGAAELCGLGDGPILGADGEPVPAGGAELAGWIQAHVHEGAHAAGTCGMGRVVDEAGRVLGVRGVRVVDMSIAPRVPRANTHLCAVMLGECLAPLVGAGA